MVRLRSIILVPVAALVVVAAGCGSNSEDVPAGAIAVVDGQEVSKAKFDRMLDQAQKGYKQSGRNFPKQGTPEYQTLKTNAVNYLVERLQFELAAEDLGVDVSEDDVTKRLGDLKKQYFCAGSPPPTSRSRPQTGCTKVDDKKYQAALKQSGKTDADVRADVQAQLLQEGVAAKLTEDIKVSDDDIQKYYNQHKQQFGTAASRDVRHILISVCQKGASAEQSRGCLKDAKAKQRISQLRAQLKNGASFAALAKKYSTDPGSKDAGGKLTVSKGATVPEFDEAAFSLQTHVLSQPIKTQYGYHLIEPLSSIRPRKTTALKDVRAQIRSQLVAQKRSEALTKWVQDTKKKYADKTDYQVGFAPPKSSTQTVSR
jgi:FKBP-type peptidyl-prolyl cis-trans isomerase (trigger factor)